MSRHTEMIDWPHNLDRTRPDDRVHESKFSVGLGRTTGQITTSLDRIGVDSWDASIANGHTKSSGLPLHNAAPDDPGFVLRWTIDGTPHAAACDRYTKLADNVRAVYLWLEETRKRNQRPVATAADTFAAAALPAGDDEVLTEPPHDVLELQPTASDAVVREVARQKKAAAHPDSDQETRHTIKQIAAAEEMMLDG